MALDRRQLLAAAADADRQVRLDGRREVPGVLRRVVGAGRHGLRAVEHAAHDGQRLACFVRPQAKAQKAKAQFGAHFLHLLQVAASFGACLVQIFNGGARQLKLPCRF